MEEIISLCNNKYTLIYNNNGEFKCLRYCEDWRDLTGDKMVYALFCEIQRLKEKCGEIENV